MVPHPRFQAGFLHQQKSQTVLIVNQQLISTGQYELLGQVFEKNQGSLLNNTSIFLLPNLLQLYQVNLQQYYQKFLQLTSTFLK